MGPLVDECFGLEDLRLVRSGGSLRASYKRQRRKEYNGEVCEEHVAVSGRASQ